MSAVLTIARIILGLYFVFNGVNHFTQLQGLSQYSSAKKIPAPGAAVVLTGLILLAGGLGILTGYLISWAIGGLVLFLLATALFIHNFWTLEDANAKAGEMANFLKNIALAAALVMLTAYDWSW